MSPLILHLIVAIPILAVFAILLGSPARVTALASAGLVLALSLGAALSFETNLEGDKLQFSSSFPLYSIPGLPQISLGFGLDGFSLVMLLLSTIVMVSAIAVAPAPSSIEGSPKLYYSSLLLIGAGAIGAFLSTDLFFFYAFHELALIPTFLMIGLYGYGKERVRTAWMITIYLGVGSLILLVGLLLAVIGLGADTFEIADLAARADNPDIAWGPGKQTWVFGLLLVGFGILVSLFPFHSWAAPAYAKAPTPVAMLHAGVLKKFGLYGLIRVALPIAPEGAATLQNVLLILLLGNILYLGLVTIAQRKLDRLLGYSSVMHMGYVFLGIAAGNHLGIAGAVLLMFAHGLSIALLFALAGHLRERFGTLELSRLGGVAKITPLLGLFFAMAAFASAGLPGFANFAAEVEVFFAAFHGAGGKVGWLQWTAILALWGVVISAVYMLRAFRAIFMGPNLHQLQPAADLTWKTRLPILLLLVGLLAIGFAPELLNQFIRPATESLFLTTRG